MDENCELFDDYAQEYLGTCPVWGGGGGSHAGGMNELVVYKMITLFLELR